MKITASLAILTLLTFTLIFLFSFQQVTASENFKIRVWLANVKPDTGQVQLCVDVKENPKLAQVKAEVLTGKKIS